MKIKQNDTRPYARATLYEDEEILKAADVSSGKATNIKFNMKLKGAGGPVKVDEGTAVRVTDGIDGKVEYRWTTGDTDTIGTYDCEFEVTWTDGGKQTFPPDKYLTVEIVAELS
jgi:hypothetical protein